MLQSDLRSSLQYRLYQRLRGSAEQPDPEALWPEGIRRRPYEAVGACAKFIACTDQEVIASGPSETGKTRAALSKLNDLAWAYPGMQGAIVRKVQRSMAGTVLQTFSHKVLPTGCPVEAFGGNNPERYIYPNGSTLWVGGMDNPDKILSAERDVIYVNQAEELSLADWETLLTRVTGRAGNIPNPQLIGDCNPAAPSHWIKARASKKMLRLFETTHRDNPMLYQKGKLTPAGKRTLMVLDRLTGTRKLRLRHGIWASPEGAIYEVFDEKRHKVHAFRPPDLWPRFVGIDPMGARIAAVLGAWDPKAEVLNIYGEYSEPFGLTTPGHVANLLKMTRGQTIWAWIGGGPSERQQRTDWAGAGIPLLEPPADVDVWGGIDKVIQLMTDFRLVIHESCVGLLSEIGSYQRVMQGDTATDRIKDKETYHLLDALRYMVAWLTAPGQVLQVRQVEVHAGDW